ncbi:hypothetical protein [Actinomadura sp. GTD37]|uniref:hypothetical protein n=1 Tax=Actinomadura sp. GTD37 TaxID=1778030 RepID=UPI0035C24AAE
MLGTRVAGHFGGPPAAHRTFRYAGSADEALARLDAGYAAWTDDVSCLDDLARPSGLAEAPSEDLSR